MLGERGVFGELVELGIELEICITLKSESRRSIACVNSSLLFLIFACSSVNISCLSGKPTGNAQFGFLTTISGSVKHCT